MNEIVATSQSIEPQQTEASSLSSNKFNALLYGYNWRSSDITFSLINEVDSSFSNDYFHRTCKYFLAFLSLLNHVSKVTSINLVWNNQ